VKLLPCWFGKDKLGNDTIKFHCIDVDTSNHSEEDCAKAIKKSLEFFTGRDGFGIIEMTGDAGGGSSVQSLLPHMKRLSVVSKDCSKDQLWLACVEQIMSGVIVSRCICQTRDRAQDSISTALGIQPAMEASRRIEGTSTWKKSMLLY